MNRYTGCYSYLQIKEEMNWADLVRYSPCLFSMLICLIIQRSHKFANGKSLLLVPRIKILLYCFMVGFFLTNYWTLCCARLKNPSAVGKINLKLKNQTSVVWFFWSTFRKAEWVARPFNPLEQVSSTQKGRNSRSCLRFPVGRYFSCDIW